jgi:hypothetical protein
MVGGGRRGRSGGGGCLGVVVWLGNFLFGVAYGVFRGRLMGGVGGRSSLSRFQC